MNALESLTRAARSTAIARCRSAGFCFARTGRTVLDQQPGAQAAQHREARAALP